MVADEECNREMDALLALFPTARAERQDGGGGPAMKGMSGIGRLGWPCSGRAVDVGCGDCPAGPPQSDRFCWAGCGADRKSGPNNLYMQ